jgi:hypothetical protein
MQAILREPSGIFHRGLRIGETLSSADWESQPCASSRNKPRITRFVVFGVYFDADDQRTKVDNTDAAGWAVHELQEAGAIRECEEHGWMHDRADPHARERAFDIARQDPPAGVSRHAAEAAVRDVLDLIGDTCPECAPNEEDWR